MDFLPVIIVTKNDGTKCVCTIMQHKFTKKYSFVNITKGHICSCEFNTQEEAIEDFRVGKPLIVADDEDRENEGDLIISAEFATPEFINFMAREARGLICLAISSDIADKLDYCINNC